MVETAELHGEEQRSLLSDSNNGDRSWRLNFEGFQISSEHTEKQVKPSRGLYDCYGVLGICNLLYVEYCVQAFGSRLVIVGVVFFVFWVEDVVAFWLCQEDNIAEYYQQQVEVLEGFTEMDALAERGFIPGMSKEERDKLARSETFAIRLSNVANMVLFVAKVYASIRSGSLAIIASTLDSLLDLLSGFILWFTAFSMQTPNPYQYPIGKKRMQPLGILVFASVMATLGLQIILESIRTLIYTDNAFNLTKEQERWVVGIMLSVTLVKFLLMIYCRTFTNEIIKAYAQDHFFDVITNVIGLIAALLANYVDDWMDPVGAIIAVRHIDTVRAYTFGSHYFVEVDIVLPADMQLQEAHDIGESLQEKLELLPEIERAFVHLDYEYSHKPEHAQSHS
ncbi:Metal tolerance protein [Vigna angularis]|uniref:Metal tolerance protein n=1 Tax=Phaseolus angularis TaxID=3914 RepID=A0A8T0L1I7_PHAAN|nr:Metal tolerance protein [Vigna angularis]